MANSNHDKKTKGSIVNDVMDFFEKNGFKKHSDHHKKLVKSNGDTVEAIDNNTAIRFGNHNFGFAEIHNHTAESIKKITTKAFKENDVLAVFYPTARQRLDKRRTNEKATGRGSR
jgi:hypothetical protein